jgi:hypothetical protein
MPKAGELPEEIKVNICCPISQCELYCVELVMFKSRLLHIRDASSQPPGGELSQVGQGLMESDLFGNNVAFLLLETINCADLIAVNVKE